MTQLTQSQANLQAYLLKWRERFGGTGKGNFMVAHVDYMLSDFPETLEDHLAEAVEKRKEAKEKALHELDLEYTYWRSCAGYIEMMHNMYQTYGSYENMPEGM